MTPRVAAVVTEYRKWSHADTILSKLLKGYDLDGKAFPALKLVSLYTDQVPANDMSRPLAQQHGFRLSPTIADALTLGTGSLAVDGVILLGEHGTYPTNRRGQTLYPRRRFVEETCAVFKRAGRAVPVFADKHLAAEWADAEAVWNACREQHVPLLAGSSVPLAQRRPNWNPPRGTVFESAFGLGYGPLEGYGFHALEAFQCVVERRTGGETGVTSVQCLQGKAMWDALDAGGWTPLLETLRPKIPAHAPTPMRESTIGDPSAAVFRVDYADGLRGAVAMLNGWLWEGDGGAFGFAGKVKGEAEPRAFMFYLQNVEPFGHFSELVRAIERHVRTAHPPYPPERTLLTTGILDGLMISKAEGGRAVATPHLAKLAYG